MKLKNLISILLLALICMTCKKADNDEEYRKLIIGRWVHFKECSSMLSLDACNDYYTFYDNGYYTLSPSGHVYFNYYIENGHLVLSYYSSEKTDYEIIKLKISPINNKDLKLKDTKTGEELNFKYNGK
jgi:hypothetical protein